MPAFSQCGKGLDNNMNPRGYDSLEGLLCRIVTICGYTITYLTISLLIIIILDYLNLLLL